MNTTILCEASLQLTIYTRYQYYWLNSEIKRTAKPTCRTAAGMLSTASSYHCSPYLTLLPTSSEEGGNVFTFVGLSDCLLPKWICRIFESVCLSLCFYVRSTIQQEGWLSPTERASVSAISLRQHLATSRESRRYIVAFTRFAGGSIWQRQESLRHILASPGIIAVNVIWIKRGFNACKTTRCIPIYLRPFPSNSTLQFQKFAILAHFCTFWPPLGTPLGQSR